MSRPAAVVAEPAPARRYASLLAAGAISTIKTAISGHRELSTPTSTSGEQSQAAWQPKRA